MNPDLNSDFKREMSVFIVNHQPNFNEFTDDIKIQIFQLNQTLKYGTSGFTQEEINELQREDLVSFKKALRKQHDDEADKKQDELAKRRHQDALNSGELYDEDQPPEGD